MGEKGSVTTGFLMSPFSPKNDCLRGFMMTAWIKSEARETIKIIIVLSAKLA